MVNLVDSNYCEMSWPTKTLIFVIIWLLISCIAADAARPPANIIKYKQPDGSVVLLAPHGDEYFSYYTTPDGNIVTPGGDSFFYYATLDRNGIHSSGVRITLQNNTKSSTVASSENLHVLSDLRQKRMSGLQGISVRASSALPESGPGGKKLTYLVIPVQFKDVKFTLENPKGFFNDFFNCKGYSYDGATGSVADYFNDNFGGAYDFSFVISDMVTLDKELAYYGGRTEIAADANIEELVVSACEAVSKSGADFAVYDNNGDGYADNVAIVFAGVNEAQSAQPQAIWPQKGDISHRGVSYGGVTIGSYTCTSEYNCTDAGESYPATIGLFCHEFAHVLGLPDLYDVNGETEGLSDALYGSLSLMDGGSYLNEGRTPPYFNSLEREILGIADVEDLVAGNDYILSSVDKQGRLYRIPSENSGEYFLVECRNAEKWDRYCGGDGIVVYHIDKSENVYGGLSASRRWSLNVINSYAGHECARSLMPLGENKIKELSYRSAFPLRNWDGRPLGLKLSDINYNGTALKFTVEDDTEWSEGAVNILNATCIAFDEDAHIKWSFSSEADTVGGVTNIYWRDSAGSTAGQAVSSGCNYLISGLEPGHLYNAELFFEKDGEAGNVYGLEFKTDTVTSPYPYMKIKGEYKSGDMVYLRVMNRNEEISSIRYTVNSDYCDDYVVFGSSGTYVVMAIIEYSDGSRDIIKKIVKVTE